MKRILTLALLCSMLSIGAWQVRAQEQELSWSELIDRATELLQQKKIKEAKKAAFKALDIVKKEKGEKNVDVAGTLNVLGDLYFLNGEMEYAELYYSESFYMAIELVGITHPMTLLIRNNLADVYRKLGDYEKAIGIYAKILQIQKETLSPDEPAIGSTLSNLAVLYAESGDDKQAEEMFTAALKFDEKIFGADHMEIAIDLSALANFYASAQRYDEAMPLYDRALSIVQPRIDTVRYDLASLYRNAAFAARGAGDVTKSEDYYRRAITLFEQREGGHANVASTLRGLALLYQARGRYTDAEQAAHKAIEAAESGYGVDNAEVGRYATLAARIYVEQGLYAKALPLLQRAYTMTQKKFGPDKMETGNAANNLAEAYRNLKKPEEAEKYYVLALAAKEKALEPKHPSIAVTLLNLSQLYIDRKDLKKAGNYADRALAINELYADSEPVALAYALANAASVRHFQSRFTEAKKMYKRAIRLLEQGPGANTQHTQTLMYNLLEVHRQLGETKEAQDLEKKLGGANKN